MQEYRNSQKVQAAKVAEVSGILQGQNGTVTCVLRFEDGTSAQENFQWFILNNGAVGSYIVKYPDDVKGVMAGATFESMFAK